MFLKLKGNELKIEAPKKLKLRRAKSSLTLGSLADFLLFLVVMSSAEKLVKHGASLHLKA